MNAANDYGASQYLGRPLSSSEIAWVWEFDAEASAICVFSYYEPEQFSGRALDEDLCFRNCFVGGVDIEILISADRRRRLEREALDELKRDRRIQECEDFDAEAA